MYGLLIEHRTRPGKRDEVKKIWEQHMQPALAANPDHKSYAYSFGANEDVIAAFQVYTSQSAAEAFLRNPSYLEYVEASRPLLTGEPKVTVLDVQWLK